MPQQPSTGKAGTSQAVLFASLKLYNPLSARPLDVFQRIEGEAVGRRAKEEVGVDVASLSPPSLACYQESNHGDHHQRCACLDLSLVVFAHAPILGQPEEGPFHDPPFRLNSESTCARRTLHHLQLPGHPPPCTSRPHLGPGRPRQPRFSSAVGQSILILPADNGRLACQACQPARRTRRTASPCIHQEMALAPFDPFVRIESTDAA